MPTLILSAHWHDVIGLGVTQGIFGGPNSKDYSILGSILGFPYLGKRPYWGYTRIMEKKLETTICCSGFRISADPPEGLRRCEIRANRGLSPGLHIGIKQGFYRDTKRDVEGLGCRL